MDILITKTGKNDVTVKLYKKDGTLVATTTTKDTKKTTTTVTFEKINGNYYNPNNEEKIEIPINEDGRYSFGRVWKSDLKDANKNYTDISSFIDYYVEFEYDGVKYKATDVYGGDSDGQANGMGNLIPSDESETCTTCNGTGKCQDCWTLPDSGGKSQYFEKEKENNPGTKYCPNFRYSERWGGWVHRNCTIHNGDSEWDCESCTDGKCSVCDGDGKVADSSKSSIDWRQGYFDKDGNPLLPGTTAGMEEYMTDSNAYEFDDVRNNFDKEYQTIGFNQSYKDNNANKSLSYTKMDHKSWLNEDSNRIMKARSFITQDFTNEDEDGISESIDNTNTLFLQSYGGHSNEYPETEYLKFINLGLVPRDELDVSIEADVKSVKTTINGEEMTYMFGTNDANSADDFYNGKDQDNAYKLNEAYNLNLYTADYNYKNDKYYGSVNNLIDYKCNESELNAEVTYKVKLHNKEISDDVPVTTAFNEIAIYYDENFMKIDESTKDNKIKVKVKNEETGMFIDKEIPKISVKYGGKELTSSNISLSSSYGNTVPEDLAAKGYKALYIKGGDLNDTYIEENQAIDLEIKFVVDKNTARNLLIADTKDDNMGLEMIAEVSAYTTKYGSGYIHKGLAGKDAGLVDIDSNPGNLNLNGIESYDNYEDDKYKVGIRIEKLTNTRSISGFVWDDARSEVVGKDTNNDKTVDSEIQYLGNGEYNKDNTNYSKANTNPNDKGENKDKDKPIEGVKVSLVEVIQTDDNEYYEYPAKDSNGNLIEAVTDKNGQYKLSDYIPGYYKVRFDYGYDNTSEYNILYNGQDYKSTTYYNKYADENGNNNALYYEKNQGYSTDNIGSKDNFGYFDKVKTSLSIANKSDAQDDEIRRLNVNSYSETMTTAQGKLFSETSVTKAKEVEKIEEEKKQDVKEYLATNDEKLTKNTQMYAESSIFYTNPEQVASGQKSISATQDGFDTIRLWNLQNLDFGLEYRPESSIVLDKNISTLELVTSDNETLVKLCFKEDENGNRIVDEKKSKGYENVQFLANNGKEEQGFVYINMDTDILEGCTIKVDYEMDAKNQSEVDRINKNLDDIKFETGANNYGTKFKVYTTHESQDNKEYSYNANGTAAQLLASQYYNGYEFKTQTGEKFNYLTQLKKPYNSSNTTTISNEIVKDDNNKITLTGQGYYGMYLGQMYYTGNIGTNDKVAELKVDHILDYIDNDFTFDLSENSTKDRLWQTTTSDELYNRRLLDFGKVNTEKEDGQDGTIRYNLIDQYGIRYDTDNRINLALTVDDNKSGKYYNKDKDEYEDRKGNVSLSKFLKNKNAIDDEEKYSGKIKATATKVLSADDVTQGKGLTYNNIAEVVQYTSLTGRRTKLPDGDGKGGVIGNANVQDVLTGYVKAEDDTDVAEVITISPPTGLVK